MGADGDGDGAPVDWALAYSAFNDRAPATVCASFFLYSQLV